MISGSIKEIRELDRVLSENCTLIKDSSKSGSKAYTKIYEAKGNPMFKRIRLFFDERSKTGSIKVRDYHPIMCGIATFSIIQVVMLMKEPVINLIEAI